MCLVLSVLATLTLAHSASASIAPTLFDPANCETLEPFPAGVATRCDDGIPSAGGTSPNESGASAVTVPARYRTYKRLPKMADDSTAMPGAASDGSVALDVAVTLPQGGIKGRVPLLVFMHGCCGGSKTNWQGDIADTSGERWHYNDAWFAARGYAVLTYTARGFINGDGDGSTGQTQLDSRSYEVNDFQHLACQVTSAARGGALDAAAGGRLRIDPKRVVATGGSYGGGFSWLALTDPRWRCPDQFESGQARMKLAAVAPRYGWTDLVHSLVPTGRHSLNPSDLPATDGCDSGPINLEGNPCEGDAPLGAMKRSIVAGLYASGKTGVPPGSSRTTFAPYIDEAISCLQLPYPQSASNPACTSTMQETLPDFLNERSAYYQTRFFRKIEKRPGWRVPIFSAGAFTDPLFPAAEHTRMVNRILDAVPGYPVKSYYGDYQHFVQNKAKEWGDVCVGESDRHVCTVDEYTRGLNKKPATLSRTGATTLLNRFLDHYSKPRANRSQRRPSSDVTASLQVCPENAGERPADEPGPRFRAPTFGALAPNRLRFAFDDPQTTFSTVLPNQHALDADPVANQAANSRRCPVHTDPAGPGVATYTSDPLADRAIAIGATKVRVDFGVSPSSAQGVQLNARLYDVFPNGSAVMVDRGPRVLTDTEVANGRVAFETHGNGWAFEPGHSIRIELAQDDDPFIHRSDLPQASSSLSLQRVKLTLPVR